jgi:hypothetical protein
MELSPSSIAEAFGLGTPAAPLVTITAGPRPRVGGREHPDGAGVDQVGQQNTNTRKLTEEMLDGVFLRARELIR